jgi:hypothetical protein
MSMAMVMSMVVVKAMMVVMSVVVLFMPMAVLSMSMDWICTTGPSDESGIGFEAVHCLGVGVVVTIHLRDCSGFCLLCLLRRELGDMGYYRGMPLID